MYPAGTAGAFLGGSFWNTHGPDQSDNVYLINGSDLFGPFINHGNGPDVGIDIPLTDGTYTFTFYGPGGDNVGAFGMNLFFNGYCCGMILADYRCGCTWVGSRRECIEYCAKHGEARRRIHKIRDVPKDEQGWDWQLDKNGSEREFVEPLN